MVKFRLSFTVGAETIFELMSRVMPIEDLEVEELPIEQPVKQAVITREIKKRHTPINLRRGANKIILQVFADGKSHKSKEITKPLVEAGYSGNGAHSHLNRLRNHDIIFQPKPGYWQMRRKPDALVGVANGGTNTA